MEIGTIREIIRLLKYATSKSKIKWEDIGGGVFSTQIDGCKIEISNNYNGYNNDLYANMTFYNVDGVQFDTELFYKAFDEDMYDEINELYDIISDRYYRKKESEKIIIAGLNRLIDK